MLGQQSITIERYSAGSYVDGVWVDEEPVIEVIEGTIVTIGERARKQLLQLPEGWRSSVVFSLYTRNGRLTPLSVQGGRTADRVVWQGRRLWVASELDFSNGAVPGMTLTHRQYLLLREEFTP